jgi:ABA DEFICIENT 4-like
MTCVIDIPEFTRTIYDLSRFIVIPGWLLLAASLIRRDWGPKLWPITQFVCPALLCILYLLMVWDGRHGFDANGIGTFFSLEGVGCLYRNPSALNAGWLHFLALDLFAATWIVREGLERGLPRWLLFLLLPLIMMLAPAGLLLYIILRFAIRPKPAAA